MQPEFAAALLDPALPPPAGLPARRFAVYRNNVVAGLVAALAARFPICRMVVGAAFFDAMAGLFVRCHPPDSPLLFRYGTSLPRFVAAFPPAAPVPFLADLARLELACGEAHQAADAPVLPIDALMAAADLAGCRLAAHPAARLLASSHPIVRIRAMHLPGATPAAIGDPAAETALVTRPGLAVEVVAVGPGTAAMFATLAGGGSFGAATLAARAAEPDLPLARALAPLFAAGALTRLLPPDPVESPPDAH